jgi:tRNA (cytidine/uridine-2'-O-)-methyltransferase
MFRIVLVEPLIPANTGNVIRLAANTGCELHLIEPLGFVMDDAKLKRAGLDYHEFTSVRRHASWAAFVDHERVDPARCFAFTTRGDATLESMRWRRGDCFVFGNEVVGLAAAMHALFAAGQRVRVPMQSGQRSLNLSNTVAVVIFDAWRQLGYEGAS